MALTGFPALEQILYDDARLPAPGARSEAADYACALAAAIGRNFAAQAAALLDDWQRPGGFREAVLTAAAGNDTYQSVDEAAGDYLNSLQQTPGDHRAPARGAPRQIPGWRQADARRGLAERALARLDPANLETARALYASPGGFGDALRAQPDEGQLDYAMRRGFERVFATLDGVGLPLDKAVEDPAARPKVETLVTELKALRQLVAQERRRRSTSRSASTPWMATEEGAEDGRIRTPQLPFELRRQRAGGLRAQGRGGVRQRRAALRRLPARRRRPVLHERLSGRRPDRVRPPAAWPRPRHQLPARDRALRRLRPPSGPLRRRPRRRRGDPGIGSTPLQAGTFTAMAAIRRTAAICSRPRTTTRPAAA